MYRTREVSKSARLTGSLLRFLGAGIFLCLAQIAHATVPAIVSATVPTNGSYGNGANLDFTVTWDQAVDVDTTGGTPDVELALADSSVIHAVYLSGSGTDTLTFRYTVMGADADGAIGAANLITLNGGTILDTATSTDPADLTSIPFAATTGVVIDNTAPSISSSTVPADATYKAGGTLDFTVTWDEAVTVDTTGGTPYVTVTLDTGGAVHAAYVSGSGTTTLTFRYTVASGNEDTNGIAVDSTAITLNSGTIKDGAGNDAATTTLGFATTAAVLVDGIAPTVSSSNRQTPATATTNATSVVYRVTFSEPVTGVDSSDFAVTATGAAAGNVASVSAVSSTVYDVTVDTISGDGTLRLDLNGAATGIADGATNAISGGYSSGQTYSIDNTAPTVTSVSSTTGNGSYGVGSVIAITVTFSEAVDVAGPGAPTLALNSAALASATYAAGSGSATLTFNYTVGASDSASDLDYAATTSLALGGDTITDAAGNSATLTLAAPGAAGSLGSLKNIVIDTGVPAVSSINRQSPAGASTNASSVTYRVTFSESVTGVDISDFTLTTTSGTTTGMIGSVSAASGSTIDVTVMSVMGDGTIRLDLNGSGTGITDGAGNAIAAGFTTGQTYTIDTGAPSVSSSSRLTPATATTNATSLVFRVIFSESVTGVDTTDFSLSTTGTATGTISSVSAASGTTIDVTVTSVSGDGTLGLDVNGTGIADAAGNGLSGGFGGQSYTIDNTAPTLSSFVRAMGSTNPTTDTSVSYTLTFDEGVTGVDVSDFALDLTGTANGSLSVTPVSSSVYTVTVDNLVGNGTVRVLIHSGGAGIADAATNAYAGALYGSENFTVTESIDARVSISANGGAGIDGGNTNTYTITVSSNGPTNAHNLGIGFTAPAELTTTGTWSCVASAGTTCPNASGTYPIAETATTLESGESLTYIVVGTVDAETVSTSITATATITPSNLQHDLSHADDTATHTDAIGVYANGFEDN